MPPDQEQFNPDRALNLLIADLYQQVATLTAEVRSLQQQQQQQQQQPEPQPAPADRHVANGEEPKTKSRSRVT